MFGCPGNPGSEASSLCSTKLSRWFRSTLIFGNHWFRLNSDSHPGMQKMGDQRILNWELTLLFDSQGSYLYRNQISSATLKKLFVSVSKRTRTQLLWDFKSRISCLWTSTASLFLEVAFKSLQKYSPKAVFQTHLQSFLHFVYPDSKAIGWFSEPSLHPWIHSVISSQRCTHL